MTPDPIPTILTDFDGVWTDVRPQADIVDRIRVERLATITSWSPEDIDEIMAHIAEALAARPHEHGWRSEGRITAYADEDPFLRHNGLMSAIDTMARGGDRLCLRLLHVLRKRGFTDMTALGSKLFLAGSREFLSQGGHAMHPRAREILDTLMATHRVVVVTNFSTDAVTASLETLGVEVAEWGSEGRLQVRGNAQKHVLTSDPPASIEVAGRSVAIDRAHYRTVIDEVRPALVLGDVFSLDLGLPLALVRQGSLSARLVLVKTWYTPGWALEGGGEDVTIIDDFGEVTSLVGDARYDEELP